MVTQIAKEVPKTPEGLPVSLPVLIPEKQNNMERRGSINVTVELKKMAIHQCQIPVQH